MEPEQTDQTPTAEAVPAPMDVQAALRRVKQGRFLDALREGGNVRAACKAAGVARPTVYEWRDADPAFAKGWAEALEDACDGLEAVAFKRALTGNDKLLMFLLRSHRPEVYGTRIQQDITSNGQPISPALTFIVCADPPDQSESEPGAEPVLSQPGAV